MTVSGLVNRSCTIIRSWPGASTDDYGNEIDDEDLIETVCEVQQQTRQEPLEGGGAISVTEWLAFFLPDEDIRPEDSLILDEDEFQVIGEPWKVRNPRTQAFSHIQAKLELIEGESRVS